MKNYSDVLGQLQDYGLLVDRLLVGTDKPVRCKISGEGKEERGWYWLHDFNLTGVGSVIVGSFGVWRGNDNGVVKVSLSNDYKLSKEQLAAIRKRVSEDKKRAQFQRDLRAKTAARRANEVWQKGSVDGHIDYLDKKGIQAHGVRYTDKGAMMVPMLDVHGQIHGLQFILDSTKHKE